jgi:hypothetical protein
MVGMVYIGALLAVAGALLVLWPLKTARAANNVRYVPYTASGGRHNYRASGVVIAAIGGVLLLVGLVG